VSEEATALPTLRTTTAMTDRRYDDCSLEWEVPERGTTVEGRFYAPLTYAIDAPIPAPCGVGFAWRFIRPGDAGESLDPRRARSSQPADYARDGGASVRFLRCRGMDIV